MNVHYNSSIFIKNCQIDAYITRTETWNNRHSKGLFSVWKSNYWSRQYNMTKWPSGNFQLSRCSTFCEGTMKHLVSYPCTKSAVAPLMKTTLQLPSDSHQLLSQQRKTNWITSILYTDFCHIWHYPDDLMYTMPELHVVSTFVCQKLECSDAQI